MANHLHVRRKWFDNRRQAKRTNRGPRRASAAYVHVDAEEDADEELDDADDNDDTVNSPGQGQRRGLKWNTSEDAQLRQMVEDEGVDKWESKAERFDTDRARSGRRKRWQSLSSVKTGSSDREDADDSEDDAESDDNNDDDSPEQGPRRLLERRPSCPIPPERLAKVRAQNLPPRDPDKPACSRCKLGRGICRKWNITGHLQGEQPKPTPGE